METITNETKEEDKVNKWKLSIPEKCSYYTEATITRSEVTGVFKLDWTESTGRKGQDNFLTLAVAKASFTRKFANKSGLRCLWYPVDSE